MVAMSLTTDPAELAEFSSARGQALYRSWTRDPDGRSYDDAPPLIEIRTAPKEEAELLVASTVEARQGTSVAAIDTTGSNLAAGQPLIVFRWTAAESLKIDVSDTLWIQVKALVGGEYVEVMPIRRWRHRGQVAVAP